MARSLYLAAACVLLFAAASVSAQTVAGNAASPNTPANDVNGDPMCTLHSLTLDGITLRQSAPTSSKSYAINHYSYTCTVGSDFTSTYVRPSPYMSDSSVEVQFNGAWINRRGQAAPHDGISLDGSALTTVNGVAVKESTQVGVSGKLTFVTGTNTIVIGVGCNGNADPTCYYQYTIVCTKPPKGTSVTGDPQFVGLRGQNYQIHGVSGQVYNIVSDADLQYNSRFVFLTSGECPVLNGRKAKGCFSHPGSYLGQLGLKTRAGDKIHIVSGKAASGFAGVSVNGKELASGESVVLAENLGSVSRNDTHTASMQIGNWDFVFENSDMYINQRVRVLDSTNLRSHGLLGQTWRDTQHNNAIQHIEGNVDDYAIRVKKGEEALFGDNFLYNAFN